MDVFVSTNFVYRTFVRWFVCSFMYVGECVYLCICLGFRFSIHRIWTSFQLHFTAHAEPKTFNAKGDMVVEWQRRRQRRLFHLLDCLFDLIWELTANRICISLDVCNSITISIQLKLTATGFSIFSLIRMSRRKWNEKNISKILKKK